MSRSTRGPRLLVPLISMLCLLGLAVSAAHAEEGASWQVEGKDASSLKPEISINEIESHDATLTTTLSSKTVEVLCTGAQPVGIKLEANGSLTSGLKVNFSGCLTKIAGATSGPCEPNNGGKEPGAIHSKALKGLLITHEGNGLVRLEPTSGETLATIETSSECTIGAEIPLIGKLTLKDSSLETEAETHLVAEGALTELWAVSKTEEHKATISGGLVAQLAGTHAGKKWDGAIPKPPVGTWKREGSAVTKELSPEVAVKEVESRNATLLTKIGGTKVEVICEEVQPVGVTLEPEGVVTVGSQVKFLSCITKLNEKTSGACEPNNAGKEPGVIASNAMKGLLIENEESGLVELAPKEGETLATIKTGNECAIGEEIPILGTLTLKGASLEEEAETHLLIAGALTELWAVSKTEEHKATIDGSVVVTLAGVHSGNSWCGAIPKGTGCEKVVNCEPEGGGAKGELFNWRVNESEVTEELEPELAADVCGTDLTLLGNYFGSPIAIPCTGSKVLNMKLAPGGTLSEGGTLRLSGCTLEGEGEEVPPCEPVNEGLEPGIILSQSLKGELFSSEGVGYLRVEPAEGEVFFVLEFSAECPLGEKALVSGTLVLEIDELETERVTHYAYASPLSELSLWENAGEHDVDGVLTLSLSGAHEGLTWSAG